MKHSLSIVLCTLVFSIFSGGCDAQNDGVELKVPRGYLASLEVERGDHLVRFGPFVGYYFKPLDATSVDRLHFITLNEQQFYTRDLPENVKLFEGEAVLVDLEPVSFTLPHDDRINPVLFKDAPEKWVENRPEPQDQFVHFHSCYDIEGPVLTGFWLKHTGVADFTYDMGGRVEKGSVLFHQVQAGVVDREFARIMEFDRGPPL